MTNLKDILAEVVFYRTYSRQVIEGNEIRMQSWSENARRNADFIGRLGELGPSEVEAIYEHQRDFLVTPPGRVLWAAEDSWINKGGYANYLGLFNCLSKDTEFITSDGVRSFSDYAEGDNVQVIGSDGRWTKATIVSGGTQPLNEITLRRGSTTKKVLATPNHRWVKNGHGLLGNSIITDLKVGDTLASVGTEEIDSYYMAQGIAYGRGRDGCTYLYRDDMYLLPYLVGYLDSIPPTTQYDVNGNLIQCELFLKGDTLPPIGADVVKGRSYLMGLMSQAYILYDKALLKIDDNILPWLREITNLLGVNLSTYVRDGLMFAEFAVYDRNHYRLTKTAKDCAPPPTPVWEVIDIKPSHEDEVWCLSVPDGEVFLLAGGLYTGNCVGIIPVHWEWFGLNFLLLMMGCGVGCLLEEEIIAQLPLIKSRVPRLVITNPPGTYDLRPEHTTFSLEGDVFTINVGDSKEGWVDSYVKLLTICSEMICSDPSMEGLTEVRVDLGGVRPDGSPIKGFGGTANPIALPLLYERVIEILTSAAGRRITPYEACLLLNWAAIAVVSGNVRRSARWDGYTHMSPSMEGAKDNMWVCTNGKWSIDPDRDCLRMVNISAIFHEKPTLEQCTASVQKQYDYGEGALVYAPAAIVRGNADLLNTRDKKVAFEVAYTSLGKETARAYLRTLLFDMGYGGGPTLEKELDHRMMRYVLNPCAEIIGTNFVCSLSQLDLSNYDTSSPTLLEDIGRGLDVAALIVCTLLKRGFDIPELQESREMDPIVAVTLNGVFDYLVNMYGDVWLKWWMAGCPEYWRDELEAPDGYLDTTYGGWHSQLFMQETEEFFKYCRDRVGQTVRQYCEGNNMRVPNRYTAMQPSGSKSCVTGGTPACYPPKGMYWVRRVTLRRDHPVALAAIDCGYKVVPSTSCRDSSGALLDDPYAPEVNEWLIEIPQSCSWSSKVQGVYDVARAPITSQWYLTMACQKYYVTHNTSSTLEIDCSEVSMLAHLIHKEILTGGDYVSTAILARDKGTMPRMPYEVITAEQYDAMLSEALHRGQGRDFKTLVEYYYNTATNIAEVGPTLGCDGDSCTLPVT
jgi:ribonucleotide reductase, class II